MASQLDIWNLALSHFGQAADIASLTEQSVEAQACARFYPIALNEALEEFDWSFARRRTTLAELTNDRPDFAYKYQRPADCLIERRLLFSGYGDDQNDGVLWQRETDYVYTNAELSVLVYTGLLTDTTKFSTQFVVALTWRLAGYISGPIIKDPSGATAIRLMNVAARKMGDAKVADANRDPMRATHVSTARAAHGSQAQDLDRVDRG